MKKQWFYKDLEMHRDRPNKPFPFVQCVLVMIAIFGLLALLDKCGFIKVC